MFESKKHGKLKGKHLRHALNWHNLMASFQDHAPDAWPTGITLQAMTAAAILGQRCEQVAAEVRAAAAKAQQRDKPDASGSAPDAALRTHAARIHHLRGLPLPAFLEHVKPERKQIILQFAAALLQMMTVWFDSTCLRSHSVLRDEIPDDAEERLSLVWHTLALLEKLQLVACRLSTNPNGAKKLFAITRPLQADTDWKQPMLSLLGAMQVPEAKYKAPSQREVEAERPPSAPTLVFQPMDVEAASTHLELLNQWMV